MKAIAEVRLENLKLLIKEAGSITELAKLAGYKQPSYLYQIVNQSAIQNGKPKNIGSNMARKLEVAMNKPENWMEQPHQQQIESNAKITGNFEEWDDSTPLSSDDVEIPLYKEVQFSAGNGTFEQEDYNGSKLRFSARTLRRHGVQPDHAVCVSITGNSMEPVLPEGAVIGINTADTQIRDGKIYAINHGGLLRTKILQKLPDNKVRIKSYNSTEFTDEEAELSEISIIGRVFWWSVLD